MLKNSICPQLSFQFQDSEISCTLLRWMKWRNFHLIISLRYFIHRLSRYISNFFDLSRCSSKNFDWGWYTSNFLDLSRYCSKYFDSCRKTSNVFDLSRCRSKYFDWGRYTSNFIDLSRYSLLSSRLKHRAMFYVIGTLYACKNVQYSWKSKNLNFSLHKF